MLDIVAERVNAGSGGAAGGGDTLRSPEMASVSVSAAESSPLHVRVLVTSTSLRSMNMYVALIGASNQPCQAAESRAKARE